MTGNQTERIFDRLVLAEMHKQIGLTQVELAENERNRAELRFKICLKHLIKVPISRFCQVV
jgi:hypothetical protein